MEYYNYIIAFFAALAAGFVNAIAGGGTLITFPVLVALGIPPVAANITNTIALCPGYFGGTYAQRKDFLSQKTHLWFVIPSAIIGGICGGVLLLCTSENTFRIFIPYLILTATIILALQKILKNYISKRKPINTSKKSSYFLIIIFVFFSSIYGGYFGAGLGVILMAIFGLIFNDSLIRINALKQATSFCINVTAAIYFCFSGLVNWPIICTMLIAALCGGTLGGKLVNKINPEILRIIIITAGIIISMLFFLK